MIEFSFKFSNGAEMTSRLTEAEVKALLARSDFLEEDLIPFEVEDFVSMSARSVEDEPEESSEPAPPVMREFEVTVAFDVVYHKTFRIQAFDENEASDQADKLAELTQLDSDQLAVCVEADHYVEIVRELP